MSTPTKLGAKAANSLREKRRVSNNTRPQNEQSNNNVSYNNDIDNEAASGILEVSMTESQASSTSNRSNVYSFFDPADIRKPPTSPLSMSNNSSNSGRNNMRVVQASAQSFDETNNNNNEASWAGGDDAASRCSTGSAATERIGNHKSSSSSSSVPAMNGAASSAVRPSSSTWIMEEKEVKYEEGATELFMLVEDAKWEEVCDRVEEEPSDAKVWVVSSGTENTVFSWSVWRRLPLHEACRRQPPPVVIYSLLSAYPESSMAESNFGELPLHAAVRCGACAEVVNCIIASYPAAALARDNSGCTPLDILNGTGKMMDHDAVVAALNRTICVLIKEEQAWEHKISSMQQEFKQSKEKRKREYERVVATKNAEIEDLERTLDQEKLATSNLASKVIQTEQVVQDKSKLEKRYQEKIKRMEEEIKELVTGNSTRKSKIKDLEDIVRSDRKAILELNNRVQTLQLSMTQLLQEEEAFAATKLVSAENNFKALMESQFVFLREAERRKDLLRGRVKQLGIKIPPKKKLSVEEDNAPPVEEVSNNEVAEKALASAMAQLNPYMEYQDETEREE
mmetsp:Transcript_20217/g.43950  ORF Transcript_20217/g.43950 Transcript_20217/m.43950 type:complete len:567 (-) Transcript_20217:226-1926(-)